MTTGKALAPALLALLPVGVSAQTFTLPAGCEAFVTVQSKDCNVSHHFICEGDPDGHQRRADLDENELVYVGRIDSEAQWIESFHLRSGHSERLGAASDPASFTGLLADNRDTWDFVTESDEIGPTRYVGEDRLTGEEVVIDGVTLMRTEYEIVAEDGAGNEIWRATGREFASRDWRMFLSGESSYVTTNDTFETDGSPMEFIFPGETGFLSVNPKYGCGEMMSFLDQR